MLRAEHAVPRQFLSILCQDALVLKADGQAMTWDEMSTEALPLYAGACRAQASGWHAHKVDGGRTSGAG